MLTNVNFVECVLCMERVTEDLYISQEPVLQELLADTKPEYVKKGTLLIEAGEVQAQLPVLIKGVLRGFLLDAEGRDITDCFAFRPGDIAAGCNVLGGPSQISMEAVTDCQVLLLPMTVVQEEMEQNMEALRLYNRYLVEALQRHWEGKMLMHRFSAMQRYQWFLQTYPGLIDTVCNKHIASFLGMTPVTLSRLRRQLREQDPAYDEGNCGNTAADS